MTKKGQELDHVNCQTNMNYSPNVRWSLFSMIVYIMYTFNQSENVWTFYILYYPNDSSYNVLD